MGTTHLSLLVISIVNCVTNVHGYSANVTSSPEIVYNWTSQHCPNGVAPYQWDVPDAPVRAYKQNSKNITWLLASVNLGSRANFELNEDLTISQANHSCDVYYNSTNNHNVSMFSDREWIYAPYIMPNSDTVYSLVHQEFHGWSDVPPDQQCTDPFPACWYNVLTTVISNDGGLSWKYILPPPKHLSAALPYKYFYNQPMFGWRSPSNILFNSKDKYYYATTTTAAYSLQKGGTTVMRTNDLSVPSSWKCYNGTSKQFDVEIGIDPYTAKNYIIEDHICTIVTNASYPTLLWSEYYNKFMMVAQEHGQAQGFSFTLSDNFINWDEWSLIRKGYHNNQTYHEIYPSFIDPNCNSLNYDCVGKNGYLYWVVARGKINGTDTIVRDIYRQHVEFY
eukprot:394316_1